MTVSTEGDKQMSANTPPGRAACDCRTGMDLRAFVGQGLRKKLEPEDLFEGFFSNSIPMRQRPGEHRRRRPESPALGVTALRS
ncbi:hypothetical protein [Mesorhizobium sp. WSM3879]|uniref:hypothetical protein n=1 Tax=Mesorhizobium sp. WSM3879 TaxID=2029406 RepID=UPI0011802E9E|nr:hypothetical protein [Mesorhizobium sp. WSM3879]